MTPTSKGSLKSSFCFVGYQEEISFETQSKIVLMTNNLPKFNAFDKAMTDRIKIMPFNAVFTNNPVYMEKLKENIDELFSYIVRCDRSKIWDQKNLGTIPRVMKEATMGYFRENDTMEMFIDECCEVGDGHKVGAKEIYDRYVEWCDMGRQKKVIRNKFFLILEGKFEKKKLMNGNIYLGIKIT